MPKLCIDCRHYDARGRTDAGAAFWALCRHPSSVFRQGPDLVPGTAREPVYAWCDWARRANFLSSDLCGPEGKHWEHAAKEPVGFV